MMDVLFEYKIPVLHPVVVHFPLSLVLLAALATLVWALRGTAFWRRCSLLLLSSGMVGLVAAYFTGEAMKSQSEGVPIVDELVGLHELLALYAMVLTGVALTAMGGLAFWLERRTTILRNPRDPKWARVLLALVVWGAALLVVGTGHLGGVMTWGV